LESSIAANDMTRGDEFCRRRGSPPRRRPTAGADGEPTEAQDVSERIIEADGIELCTETFGAPGDPPVLLIMGSGASMLWWDDAFCAALAAGGRFVVRYDHRDSGRSTACPPGRPDYGGADLVADAARVLDGHRIARAHVVGASAGGALAQLLALDHPDRVASLVLLSTSPAGPGDDLPPVADAYAAFLAGAAVDWSDPRSIVEHVVADVRALSGERPFDEPRVRALVERDVARARSPASAQNHALLDGGPPWRARLGAISVPTLVIHGSADPLFALGHGEALAREIPGARLLVLDGAGHVLHPADHHAVVAAILEHTAR
jgi:pimeloyl-ACP methyl ester carboxylesterase